MIRKPVVKTATIAASATTSDAIETRDYALAGLIMPATLTSSTVTFTVCETAAGTYKALYDSDGNQVSIPVAASRAVGVCGTEADALAPFHWFRLVGGSTEVSARSISVLLK